MLPFLPALLLLIFRGPAAFERAQFQAVTGREAIYQNLGRRNALGAFAASKRHTLSKAVAQLLYLQPIELTSALGKSRNGLLGNSSEICTDGVGRLRDGYYECERSRDGPSSL
jgi:hypothetical protein